MKALQCLRKHLTIAVLTAMAFGGTGASAATLTVTTASDEVGSVLSLREAIAQALPGDEINFDSSLAGQSIGLTQGQLTIDKDLTITGLGASLLNIDANTQPPTNRRVFEVAPGTTVSISKLTIRGGSAFVVFGPGGGGILNYGNLTVGDCSIENNNAVGIGGGIANWGYLSVIRTTVKNNHANIVSFPRISTQGGGIYNVGNGVLVVTKSAITGNTATAPDPESFCPPPVCTGGAVGGGVLNLGTLTLEGSTVANNKADVVGFGGGIANFGTISVTGSTISANVATGSVIPGHELLGAGGGLGNSTSGNGGTIKNTILTGNSADGGDHDCSGGETLVSGGNNIVGELGNCPFAGQSSDQQGDPRLGELAEPGLPGQGRLPLLSDSPAINVGDDGACAATDQLDTPRRGTCDIGAVEFYPVINDLIAVGNIRTNFDPTPVPNAPAGTFHITADFTNNSGQPIVHPFTEVIQLTDNDLLLNANGGSGGVGARVVFPNFDTPFEPGATQTLDFSIGLQTRDPFNFLVNVLGDAGASN